MCTWTRPGYNAPLYAAQDTVGLVLLCFFFFFCCKGALLTHCKPGVHQSQQSCFPAHQAPLCRGTWAITLQMQDFEFPLAELGEIPLHTILRLATFPFHGSPSCGIPAMPLHFVSPMNLLRVHSSQAHRSIMKILNSASPSTESCSLESLVPCL